MEEEKKDLDNSVGVTEGEEKQEKTIFTAEEVEAIKKDLASNYEKGVQKVISEKKAYEEMLEIVDTVSENPSELLKLHSKNPKSAKIILDKWYGGISIEEYKKEYEVETDYNDPEIIEKLVEERANKRVIEKLMEDKKSLFIKKLEISGEQLEKFEEEFEDRKNLKSFSLETFEKHLEKAYKETIGNNEMLEKVSKDLGKMEIIGNNGGKGAGKSKIKEPSKIEKELDSFLKNL